VYVGGGTVPTGAEYGIEGIEGIEGHPGVGGIGAGMGIGIGMGPGIGIESIGQFQCFIMHSLMPLTMPPMSLTME
jgi:hypothetical protein